MPSQWNADADRDLLLSIIEEEKLKSIQWHNVSARLAEKGYSFSHEACRQHFQKLRRESKAATGGGGGGAASVEGTPRSKNKKAATPKSGKGGKNGRAYATDVFEDDDESAHFDQTPSKKRKVEKFEEDVPGLHFKMEMNGDEFSNDKSYVDIDHDAYYD